MKAHIEDLSGKYYGTTVDVEIDSGNTTSIEVWANSNEPSKRQLEEDGYTQEDWDNNALVETGYGGKGKIRESDLFCDNHFETKESYLLASIICDAINNIE